MWYTVTGKWGRDSCLSFDEGTITVMNEAFITVDCLGWGGCSTIHDGFTAESVMKEKHPDAEYIQEETICRWADGYPY